MAAPRRPIRLATVSHRPSAGVDGPAGLDLMMAGAVDQVARAARFGADLVAFPKVSPQLALPEPWHHAEPAVSGSLDRAREAPRAYKVYIV